MVEDSTKARSAHVDLTAATVTATAPHTQGESDACAQASCVSRRRFLGLVGSSAVLGATSIVGLDFLEEAKASEILANGPTKGKRWALVVDVWRLQSEADYERIIQACHRNHNVPRISNPKHEVKWIWTEQYKHAFPDLASPYVPKRVEQKPFLVLCNHCDEPPCVRVCPVKATFKRADGVVMQDMHRCIGCKFCVVACPYGARSYNWVPPREHLAQINPDFPPRTLGVVEKCNFCHERLDRGLPPLCVEASGGALIFGDLNDPSSAVRQTISSRYTLRRKSELGTEPKVFYVV
jgi:Fe-S-cluster-containing dehydrogenase component